jgi:GT2 family glycosyltransferase
VSNASVDVVVVRWRGGAEVERCIRSLTTRGGGGIGRIVLVDSGSGDGGGQRLATTFPEIDVVLLEENRSFAWAVSQGVQRCSEALLWLLNPDTEIQPDSLAQLTRFLSEHPEVCGAVPLLVHPDGSEQHRWQLRRLPTASRLALGMRGRPQFGADPPTTAQPVEQPAASSWLIRRSLWDELKGLDPVFEPAWWEDVDFCKRLADRVGRSSAPPSSGFWLVPSSRVVHSGGSSLIHLGDASFLAAYFRNLMRYAERHHRRQLRWIRSGLILSLKARAVMRPSRANAYREAVRALRS